MLVLTRKIGETIRIGDEIEVQILDIRGGQVRIGVKAPRTVTILRGELQDRAEESTGMELAAQTPTRVGTLGPEGRRIPVRRLVKSLV
jgi:carbon storage regulator